MDQKYFFNFKTDVSNTLIPSKLNNPFDAHIPNIARIAAHEFQEFIALSAVEWEYDLMNIAGKMFGVLVVQKADKTFCYLGSNSGKLPKNAHNKDYFIPSVFDGSTDDYFFDKGMTELSEISARIRTNTSPIEAKALAATRKLKSIALQKRLFENYRFRNYLGTEKNVLEIFESASLGVPPSAAGECAAPKLLQYAIDHQLKPIALAEFWWGKSSTNQSRQHQEFYPACESKCRPIIEFLLDNFGLFKKARLLS